MRIAVIGGGPAGLTAVLESKKIWILAVVLAALLAGAVRMSMWRTCFPPAGGFVFVDTDSYYHLRRAEWIARSYPTIPWEDPYLYYPGRGLIPWAGGYDLLLGTLITGLGALGLEGDRLEAVLAGFNPLVSVVTALVIVALTALLFGRFAALLSALLFAVLPGHITYSRYGNIDHHALVALAILLLLWLAVAALRAPERRVLPLIFGLLLGVVHTIHPSFSQLTLVLITLNAAYYFWSARHDPTLRPLRLRSFRDCFFWAALGIGGVVWMIPWELASQVHMWILSLFHVVLALSVLAVSELLRLAALRPAGRMLRMLWMRAALLALGSLALAWFSGFWPGLRDGLRVSLGEHWFLGISGESRPLWHYGFSMLPRLLSPLLFVAPLVAGLALLAAWKRGDTRRTIALAVIGAYGSLAMLLGVGNAVFVANAALFVAIFGGAAIAFVVGWSVRLLERARRISALSVVCRGLCAGGLLIVVTLPIHSELAAFADRSRYKLRQYWAMDALGRFLGEHTASAGEYHDPLATPGYSVVANRDLAHFISVRGHRAAVQNPFGEPHYYIEHNRSYARLELTADPVVAREILAEFGAGYYVSRPLAISEIEYLARIGGLDAAEYLTDDGVSKRLEPRFYSSFNTRMVMFDGAAVAAPQLQGEQLEAITYLRLVYESDCAISDGERSYSTLKLFQVVPGARLQGSAAPGQTVRVALKLVTNTGRRFIYRDQALGDRKGRFELTLPYSTERVPDIEVYAVGEVVLTIGEQAYTIPVTARAVAEGQPVRIRFPL